MRQNSGGQAAPLTTWKFRDGQVGKPIWLYKGSGAGGMLVNLIDLLTEGLEIYYQCA